MTVHRANDNRHPAIPIPKGGFTTNEEEARWLEQTMVMRMNETIRMAGVNGVVVPKGLYDLFLLALNGAARRALKGRTRA